MSDGFVLLDDGGRGSGRTGSFRRLPVARQSRRNLARCDVPLAFVVAFDVVHETAEANEGLFDFFMPVVPGFLGSRADVVVPAIGEFFGGVVKAQVLAAGGDVMGDAGFDEISAGVAFVLTAGAGAPVAGRLSLRLAVVPRVKRVWM